MNNNTSSQFKAPSRGLGVLEVAILNVKAGLSADFEKAFSEAEKIISGKPLFGIDYKMEGMLIAMIDDGFSGADQCPVFQDLYNRNGVHSTYDFVDNTSFVYDDD